MDRQLLDLILADMKPALGVTEPAAIALACATARRMTEEPVERVLLRENSGMYKNAFTCGIPNTDKVGNFYAAALGCLAGDPDKGLLVLEGIGAEDVARSQEMVEAGCVTAEVSAVSPDLYIYARVETAHDVCEVEIRGSHTNICKKVKNGVVVWEAASENVLPGGAAEHRSPIAAKTLAEFYTFAENVSAEWLVPLREAYRLNRELAEAALASERCTLTTSLWRANGGRWISANLRSTARLFAGAASEARVLGLDRPAMSITGSGNHGIIATMPLYALAQVEQVPEETLLRATVLSYLVTMYMKEFAGKLSAFCGCGVAAGTGMACGLTLMRGGSYEQVEATLNNMASSLVGMICTGGNHACCMKVLAAVDTAITSMELAMSGASIAPEHGVADRSPEKTMQNIGLIASPGMIETERVILEIMQKK